MSIFANGNNKIGSIYYGTNKIGKVYDGTNLVYESNGMKPIPGGYGHLIWDARYDMGYNYSTYALYDSYGELIVQSSSKFSSSQMYKAAYYKFISGDKPTRGVFGAYYARVNSSFSAYGDFLGGNVEYGFEGAEYNSAIWLSNIGYFSASSGPYRILKTMNEEKAGDYSNWLIGNYDDIENYVTVYGTEPSGNLFIYETSATSVRVRYYESNKWKTKDVSKETDVYFYPVAHFY